MLFKFISIMSAYMIINKKKIKCNKCMHMDFTLNEIVILEHKVLTPFKANTKLSSLILF